MVAAVTVMAQERMKDPPKSGHEGMAKPAAAQCDAAVIAKATSPAPADIGRNAVVMGAGADGKMKELRAGTNGWMYMLDLARRLDVPRQGVAGLGDAWMIKKEPPKPTTVGVAYMLKGDKGASNTDPYADFAIDVVGTMMWAYGVPFHITHGRPIRRMRVELTDVRRKDHVMCGPLTTHWLSAVGFVVQGSGREEGGRREIDLAR
jgi:hypothetical protein